ncbi:MAG TPA: PAS domain S-box protein, partial [Geobacteraceae bacterium]|nr:PAS domain S-box protein [Geobacteraceae bacterium]
RRIIDTANEGIWVVDGDFRFSFVNARMADMLGYGVDEMLGKSFVSFLFEEDRAAHEREEETRRTGKFSRYERRFRRKDGETLWALVSVTPIMDTEKHFLGSLAMCVDITKQKRAAEALCFTQFAVDRAHLQALWMTPDYRLVYVNDAACRTLGYSRDELLSMSIPDIDAVSPPHRYVEHWRQLRDNGSIVFESMHRAKNGRVYPVEVQSNHLVFDGKEFNCSFVTDISDRKQAEEVLRTARDELEARVRERTDQLAELAEELSRAEELERRRIATELHDQVGQMLALSKIHLNSLSQSLAPDTFAQLLGDVRDHISTSINEIRSLTFQLSPPLLYEVGLGAALEGLCEEIEDKYRIRATFRDMDTIGDAGKPELLPEGTRITLYQMARELMINVVKHARANRMVVAVKIDSGSIEIIIEDDGIGFDAEQAMCHADQNKSFGLFSIQHRITHLGGTLDIQSDIGRGSRATLSVPLREDAI